jgi:hypothetical protein
VLIKEALLLGCVVCDVCDVCVVCAPIPPALHPDPFSDQVEQGIGSFDIVFLQDVSVLAVSVAIYSSYIQLLYTSAIYSSYTQ